MVLGICLMLPVMTAVTEASLITPYSGMKPEKESTAADKPAMTVAANSSNSSRENSKAGVAETEPASYVIRVGLNTGVARANASMSTAYRIINPANGKVVAELEANELAQISADLNGLAVNGASAGCDEVRLVPARKNDGLVSFNNTKYHGTLVFRRSGSYINVINEVSLDDYLKGVVPSEMNQAWPAEALKAQSVAARTFALYSRNQHISDGYDLCNTIHCQYYEGLKGEAETATAAVLETKGYVMTKGTRPICAAFHSSSGGMTENSENVWGRYQPYLRSVADDDSESPYHDWRVTASANEIEKMLVSAGYSIGTLKSINMDPGKKGRSESGRVVEVLFKGTDGTAIVDGVKLRSIFGLKSTMFSIRVQRSAVNSKESLANSRNGKSMPTAASSLQLTGAEGELVILEGHGFGHGLGMAQYGAKAMADKGAKWQDILNHYYTDIVISKYY